MRSGSSHRSDTKGLQEDKQQSSLSQYSIVFSLTTNLNLHFNYSHLLSSTPFPLCDSPFAVSRTAIAPSVRRSVLIKYRRTIAPQPLAIHPWAKPHCRVSLGIHPWANTIAGLLLRSTLGQNFIAGFYSRSTLEQIPSQDFARDPPLINLICP